MEEFVYYQSSDESDVEIRKDSSAGESQDVLGTLPSIGPPQILQVVCVNGGVCVSVLCWLCHSYLFTLSCFFNMSVVVCSREGCACLCLNVFIHFKMHKFHFQHFTESDLLTAVHNIVCLSVWFSSLAEHVGLGLGARITHIGLGWPCRPEKLAYRPRPTV